MEYKWNINKLKTMLFNEKMIALSTQDEQSKIECSLAIDQLELALSFTEEIEFSSSEYTKIIRENIESRRYKNSIDIKTKTDILASLFLNHQSQIPEVISEKKDDILTSETISYARLFPTREVQMLNNIIKNKQLFISNKPILSIDNDPGSVIYINNVKYPLVYVYKTGTYADSLYLVHELGHVKQYQKTASSYESFINQHSSVLREIVSELNELKMLHLFKGHIDEVKRLSLIYEFLNNHKEMSIKTICDQGHYDHYAISELLAIYLFILFKYDRTNYNDKMKRYFLLASSYSDLEIIKALGIDLEVLVRSYTRYKKDYIEEVNQIKKFI